MLVQSAEELIKRARQTTKNQVGMCLWQSQEWYGSPHFFADATRQWKGAKFQHPGDRNPPKGAHVMWVGGSHGHGHSAISLGNGQIRTIDFKAAGRTGETDLGWVERTWGLTYVGWTEDIGGVRIPFLGAPDKPANPNGVKVGDVALVVTHRSDLVGRAAPAGPPSGVERSPGWSFTVADIKNGWATGGHNWYSTDYLFPKLTPNPRNVGQIAAGDLVRVAAAGGLRARRFPGGPESRTKNFQPLVRARGFTFEVTADPVDGWVTGGKHWYSSEHLEIVPRPGPT